MRLLLLAGVVAVCACSSAGAQDPVKWTLGSPTSVTVARGSVTPIKVTAKIENGWKVYSPTQPEGGPFAMIISMVEGSRAAITGKIVSPPPVAGYDSSFRMTTETYTGTV